MKAPLTFYNSQRQQIRKSSRQVNILIERTIAMTESPRRSEEIDPWTQPSQPLPESGYSSSVSNQEQEQNDNNKTTTEPEKSHDFYPTEKSIAKRKRIRYTATRIKYSPTRVKSRNFLSNISYNSISKADFYNENFILDVFILLVKNLNPFSLQRKLSEKFKHEMIYMLWRECIPPAFYRFICQEDNFHYLNGRDVTQPGVLEIVGKFVDQDKNNLRLLQQCLANYKDIFQYVYSCTYPEIYTVREERH